MFWAHLCDTPCRGNVALRHCHIRVMGNVAPCISHREVRSGQMVEAVNTAPRVAQMIDGSKVWTRVIRELVKTDGLPCPRKMTIMSPSPSPLLFTPCWSLDLGSVVC